MQVLLYFHRKSWNFYFSYRVIVKISLVIFLTMNFALIALLTLLSCLERDAFRLNSVFSQPYTKHCNFMMSKGSPPKLDIISREMELTEHLSARVIAKIGKVVDKLGYDAISTHVVLRVHKLPVNGKISTILIKPLG